MKKQRVQQKEIKGIADHYGEPISVYKNKGGTISIQVIPKHYHRFIVLSKKILKRLLKVAER